MRKKRVILFILVFVVFLQVVILYILFQPKKAWSLSSLSEEQREKVMSVAIAYVEENYGTDYYINGNVTISTYTEGGGFWGEIVYNYPMASFIVPANLTQTGVSIHVLVDPDMERVVKVWTAISHAIDEGVLPNTSL
jgi:hypothetical protein